MSVAFEQSTFSMTATCLPCCAGPDPDECLCALLMPPFEPPYVDYTTAKAVIDEPKSVADCMAYCPLDTTDVSTLSATFDGTTYVVSGTFTGSLNGFPSWLSISAKSGATLTFAGTGGSHIGVVIYGCDGTEVETIEGTTPQTSAALPADGEYYIFVQPNTPPPGGGFGSSTTTITSSDDFWVNPVIALWDDSGTTRKLWACPKLLLPPLTESTGTWYADATAAGTAITDLTSNCDGYIESLTNVATFTATDGGTSLTLANTLTAGATTSPRMWGGINAADAATITVTGTVGAGTVNVNVGIYDDTGTLVESSGAVSSPWTSAALPYKGRYTIGVSVTSSSSTTSMSAAITSSGTITVNPVQAVYDVGLTCPARDDC